MSNNVVKMNSQLPALPQEEVEFLEELKGAVQQTRSSMMIAGGGGLPLLRMMRDGEWVYGQNNDECQPGAQWRVDVAKMEHGWVCWTQYQDKKNEKLGETMVSCRMPRPPRPIPIDGWTFKDQVAFPATCMSGDDTGLEVQYRANSIGGANAFAKLLDEIAVAVTRHPPYVFPIITLGFDSYPNKKHGGETCYPVWAIAGWTDRQMNLLDIQPAAPQVTQQEKLAEQAPKPAPAGKRQRRTFTTTPEPEQPAPASTTQLHNKRTRPAPR